MATNIYHMIHASRHQQQMINFIYHKPTCQVYNNWSWGVEYMIRKTHDLLSLTGNFCLAIFFSVTEV